MEQLENRELMIATPLLLDFGTATSPVEPGYTQATGATAYSAGTGYGWTTANQYADYSSGDALLADYAYGDSPGTFAVDVANGTYDVLVTVGYLTGAQNLTLEGQSVDSITSTSGMVNTKVYRTTVTDGQLNLGISDGIAANGQFWRIHELVISPAATIPNALTARRKTPIF